MDEDVFRQHADLEDDHWWFLARQRILLGFVETVLKRHPGQILDVGCGTGGFASAANSKFGCTGIDSSPLAIEIARKKFPEVQFVLGNAIEYLRTEKPPISLILLLDVLEHIEDAKSFISGICETAPSNVDFLVTVPACPMLWSEHDVTAQHHRRYTRASLQDLWRNLPVQINYIGYFNSFLFLPILFARLAAKFSGSSVGKDKTDFYLPSPPVNALLYNIFASERWFIGRGNQRWRRFPIGVSLVAQMTKTS